MNSDMNSFEGAKNAFESKEIQKSWRTHMAAFGPILEPAFADDYASRIHLTAALNFLSRRATDKALEKLNALEDMCQCDADRAALLYFIGLCHEFSGDTEKMLEYYNAAAGLGHRFYLPYLKAARIYHQAAQFDSAEASYSIAIDCITEIEQTPQKNILLATAYANFAACLTAMHKYGAAVMMFEKSKQLVPSFTYRLSHEAILYAAMDMEDKLAECLRALEAEDKQTASSVGTYTKTILDGEEAHFCLVPAIEDKMNLFWKWFRQNGGFLESLAAKDNSDVVAQLIGAQLLPAFPFMQKPLEVYVAADNGRYVITLSDGYALSLHEGFSRLLSLKPASLSDIWEFKTAH